MVSDLHIQPGLAIPADELRFTASRASGAGGQHVNRTSSRITLHWNVGASAVLDDAQRARITEKLRNRIGSDGELQVDVEDTRSQFRNRELACERLVELVRAALRVDPPRRATRPTYSSKLRRLDEKSQRSDIKRTRRSSGSDD
jgi:ribosome-associated protein